MVQLKIKNHSQATIIWADGTTQPEQDKIFDDMQGREGYEIWRADTPSRRAAVIGELDGVPKRQQNKWTVSYSDCVWLRQRSVVKEVRNKASHPSRCGTGNGLP